jgi:hypothetical protein
VVHTTHALFPKGCTRTHVCMHLTYLLDSITPILKLHFAKPFNLISHKYFYSDDINEKQIEDFKPRTYYYVSRDHRRVFFYTPEG